MSFVAARTGRTGATASAAAVVAALVLETGRRGCAALFDAGAQTTHFAIGAPVEVYVAGATTSAATIGATHAVGAIGGTRPTTSVAIARRHAQCAPGDGKEFWKVAIGIVGATPAIAAIAPGVGQR